MARSTKQQTASATAGQTKGSPRTPKATAKSRTGGTARTSNGNVTQLHDTGPGLGHPIFDELIAELGDPRRSA